MRVTKESKIEKTFLSPPSIPGYEGGGEAFSPGRPSPAGPLSFLGLPPGGDESRLHPEINGTVHVFSILALFITHGKILKYPDQT
jgi:hypothetical protein